MEYLNLGDTGLKVSRICLGMMSYGDKAWADWMLTKDESRPLVQRAVELGVNFFDTADVYSQGVSEEFTGDLLREFTNRDEVVVATKVYFPMGDKPNQAGLSRKHIMESIDASLMRLKMDYVDLYQIHRWDYETPIEETMEALHDVVRAGKARYLGGSSMYAWQFAKAQYTADLHGWTRFISMQNHYNLVYREEEREMIPFCVDQGVGVIPWSPLARGFLAGGRTKPGEAVTPRAGSDQLLQDRYFREGDFAIMERVVEVAEKHGASNAQIALAWLLHKPGVTSPVVGATKLPHLEEAAAATEIALAEEDIAALEENYQTGPILGHN